MGMEDRDWYREKKIDWDKGGLKEAGKRTSSRVWKYAWFVLAAVILIILFLLRQF